jgi:peptidoglycan hydrolase-like amidase
MSAAPLTIRIQLTELSERLWISVQPGSTINGKKTDGSEVFLSLDGTACAAKKDNGTVLASGIVRIDPGDGTVTVSTVRNELRAYRGIVECRVVDGVLTLINKLGIEPYLMGLAEEPDTEPYQKQRAFAIAARTYAAYYADPAHRKFPGKPYDGSDSAAIFQAYGGANFETQNPAWQKAVRSTQHLVLTKDGEVIRAPYFSSDDGRTKSPAEVGWKNFPFAEIFASKADPWCTGMENRGHGVGMSGCGAEGQANEGKSAEEILGYYYPGTELTRLSSQQ